MVSLLTLSLPLAGLQYVRQMDAQLLQTQAEALLDRTLALAYQLQNAPQNLAALLPPPEIGSINFQDLANRPILDGQCDDWFLQDAGVPLLWLDNILSVEFLAGRVEPDLYLCLQVEDADLQYHRENSAQMALGDHLVVHTDSQRYWLRTENPGALWAVSVDELGQPLADYTLNAFWRETERGYRIEIRVPAYLAPSRLGLEIVDNGSRNVASLGLSPEGRPLKYIETLDTLKTVIENRSASARGESIYLLSNSGSIAVSHAAGDQLGNAEPQTWLTGLYERLSAQDFLGDLSEPSDEGFLALDASLPVTTAAVNWYRHKNSRIARATVPIEVGGIRVATLVSDEPARTLSDINSAALTRLLWYTGSAFAITSFGLMAYAFWLAGRIRRLSRATSQLVQDGRIGRGNNREFRASRSRDELGELSRQYAEMVKRVDGYTQYLQSLSGKLSHEIRTPLAIVSSSLDNLEQAADAEEQRVYLQRAGEGIERLSSILSAMSQSTAIESAIESAERGDFVPAAVLTDLVQAYADLYPATPIRFALEQGATEASIGGSADLFAQMMDKLVDNAADFCTGEIEISLSAQPKFLRLSVANDGPVLPQGMADSLFDSLVSVRSAKSEKTHLGLGLFVVRRIVDFHGGKIEARNLPDKSGVAFIIELPRAAN